MEMKIFNDYKAIQPIDTIMKVRTELQEIGLGLREKNWFNPRTNIYSCQVEIPNVNFTSWGKGVTLHYSLASAYGELVEEINTGLYFSQRPYSDEAFNFLGFIIDPKEIKIDFDSYQIPDSFKLSKPFQDDTSIYDTWISSRNLVGKKITVIPFEDLLSGEVINIPFGMVYMMNGSNGLCAGNSKEEALNHGLCEILERYVVKIIFLNNLDVPNISDEYLKMKFKISYQLIKEIEQNLNYKIIVKDCTLGNKYPVMAIQIFDLESNRIAVNFGSDPDLDIALHRCITEIYQMSNDMEHKMIKFFPRFNEEIDINEYHKFIKNGSGMWPYQFYTLKSYSEPRIEFGESKVDKFNYLLKTFELNGAKAIYVRDCSYIALNSYQIEIPGFSDVYVLSDYYKNFDNFNKNFDYIKRLHKLSIKELNSLASSIENHLKFIYHGKREFVQDYIMINFDHDVWDNITLDYLLFTIYLKLRQYVKAEKALENYLSKFEDQDIRNLKFYYCVGEILKLYNTGHELESCKKFLANYYEDEILLDAITIIEKSDLLLNSLPKLNCFECDNCNDYYNCDYATNEKFYKVVKLQKMNNNKKVGRNV